MAFKSLKAIFGEAKDLKEVNDIIDEAIELSASEESEEETSEEEASEEETSEESEETSEEETEEETEDSDGTESEETEESESIDLNALYEELKATVDDTRNEIVTLKAENEQLRADLAAKTKAERDFVAKFPELYISLSNKQETPVSAPVYTNGIGEL